MTQNEKQVRLIFEKCPGAQSLLLLDRILLDKSFPQARDSPCFWIWRHRTCQLIRAAQAWRWWWWTGRGLPAPQSCLKRTDNIYLYKMVMMTFEHALTLTHFFVWKIERHTIYIMPYILNQSDTMTTKLIILRFMKRVLIVGINCRKL